MIQLLRTPIDVASLRTALSLPQDGAVVVFEGVVRNNARGKGVLWLEYDAYEPMALKKLEEVAAGAKSRYPIREISIVHRIGRLEIGECSVAIVVASAHRAAAFDACRFAIDTLKQTVPIWKKEAYSDHTVWIEGSDHDKCCK